VGEMAELDESESRPSQACVVAGRFVICLQKERETKATYTRYGVLHLLPSPPGRLGASPCVCVQYLSLSVRENTKSCRPHLE